MWLEYTLNVRSIRVYLYRADDGFRLDAARDVDAPSKIATKTIYTLRIHVTSAIAGSISPGRRQRCLKTAVSLQKSRLMSPV